MSTATRRRKGQQPETAEPAVSEQVLRATLLVLASVPARAMADLRPKVMCVALLRAGIHADASASHAMVMVEGAIGADMLALQGLTPTSLS